MLTVSEEEEEEYITVTAGALFISFFCGALGEQIRPDTQSTPFSSSSFMFQREKMISIKIIQCYNCVWAKSIYATVSIWPLTMGGDLVPTFIGSALFIASLEVFIWPIMLIGNVYW